LTGVGEEGEPGAVPVLVAWLIVERYGGGSSGDALLERGRRSGTGEVSRERNARGREGTGRGGASALFGVS